MTAATLGSATLANADRSTGDNDQHDDWIELLDGRSLDAWRGYRTDSVPDAWRLEDGVLTLEGEGGDLITREQFGDFEFRFDWRISPGGNSGVIYRVSEELPQPYKTGPEYQVLDDSAVDDPATQSAAIYALYPRVTGKPKPPGEWNTGRILLRNNRLEHWLNGLKVAEAEIHSDDWRERVAQSKFTKWPAFGKNSRGHIALQDHGARVSYRNLRVRSLDRSVIDSGEDAKRLLFVTQSQGFRHKTVTRTPDQLSHAEQVLQQLGLRSGDFRVDCTQDVANDFTPELLANYDVVAFYTTGDLPIPPETLDWFLTTWLREQGHGFLGVHSAADTYQNHRPFWDMLGGTFVEHPWTWDTDVVLKVHDGSHPASAPWGEANTRIPFTDEIYLFKNWQPEKVRVLMSLDMRRTELKRPLHIPVLWVKKYGAGRVVHMSLGHREDVWEDPVFQESLIGGVRWLLRKDQGDATPNPEVSRSEQTEAEQAYSEQQAKG